MSETTPTSHLATRTLPLDTLLQGRRMTIGDFDTEQRRLDECCEQRREEKERRRGRNVRGLREVRGAREVRERERESKECCRAKEEGEVVEGEQEERFLDKLADLHLRCFDFFFSLSFFAPSADAGWKGCRRGTWSVTPVEVKRTRSQPSLALVAAAALWRSLCRHCRLSAAS